jgi:hypothetical protein
LSDQRDVARAADGATLLARVLGLVREQVMAGLFGAGFAMDAFNVAFRIPDFACERLVEGGERLRKRGLVLLGVVCAIAWLAAPWLVRVLASGFAAVPGKQELTVLLARVMLPLLPVMAVAVARARLAPALFELGAIVVGVVLLPVCRALGAPAILAMAIGVLVSGMLLLAVRAPAGLRPGPPVRGLPLAASYRARCDAAQSAVRHAPRDPAARGQRVVAVVRGTHHPAADRRARRGACVRGPRCRRACGGCSCSRCPRRCGSP